MLIDRYLKVSKRYLKHFEEIHEGWHNEIDTRITLVTCELDSNPVLRILTRTARLQGSTTAV